MASSSSSSSSSAAATASAAAAAPVTYATLLRNAPRHHQAFVATTVVQCLTLLAERAWLFSATDLSTDGAARQAVYFLLVLALSALFVLYFAVHSVLQANAFETAAFFVASLLLLTRLAAEFVNRTDECASAGAQAVCAAFLGASVFFVLAAMAFTVVIYRDLAWKRYKAIGAEVATREMYKLYELFSAVRKLDVQFSLITLITGLIFLVGGSGGGSGGGGSSGSGGGGNGGAVTGALAANVVLFAVELAWERLGDHGVKSESPRHLWAFWALSPLLPAFVVGVAADTLANPALPLLARAASTSLRLTIAAMGALAILNRVATVVCSVLLYRNFGPNYVGLRRIIMSDRKEKFNSRGKAAYALDFGGAGDWGATAGAAATAVPAASETAPGGGGGGAVEEGVVVVENAAAAAAAAEGGSGPGRPAAPAEAAAAAARADRVQQLAGARLGASALASSAAVSSW